MPDNTKAKAKDAKATKYVYQGPSDRLRLVRAVNDTPAVYLDRGVPTPLEGDAAKKADAHPRVHVEGEEPKTDQEA